MGQDFGLHHRALIVEDDSETRGLAAALLEETDLQVVEVSSAEEALEYLRENAEDVVFLFTTVHLPSVMSGVDLARAVHSQWPWVRTVLTSGEPYEESVSNIPGDVRLMPKPWRALEVLMEAERATHNPRHA